MLRGASVGVVNSNVPDTDMSQSNQPGFNHTAITLVPTTEFRTNNPNNTGQNPSDHDDHHRRTINPLKFWHVDEIGQEVNKLVKSFNSYATKKTIATGFFNIALVTSNFAQLKQIVTITRTPQWTPLNIVLLVFICVSLLLQFVVAVILVFLAKQGEFIDQEKRDTLIRNNNGATILVLVITIINIFINVFLSIQ